MELKDKIFKDSTAKRFNGKKLNGPTLANLIVEIVEVINKGGIPNINNAWDHVVQKDIDLYYSKALNHYKSLAGKLKGCFEEDELIKIIYDYKFFFNDDI